MGTLLVLIGGLIGAGSVYKKGFMPAWIYLINLAFALYISIFLASFVVSLLEIPGLEAGYKNAIAIGGVFFIVNIILQKVTEQVIPNPEGDFNLPPISQLFAAGAGFLSGIIVAGILLYCFMQTPFVSGFAQKKELRSTARNTLMGVVYTVNAFSFQSLTPEAEKDLRAVRLLLPPADEEDQQKKEEPKGSSGPENNPAGETVKKDSPEASAPGAGKKDETKKTEEPAPDRS